MVDICSDVVCPWCAIGMAHLDAALAHVEHAGDVGALGLREMWLADPDGVEVVLVEVPAEHPLRRDPRR